MGLFKSTPKVRIGQGSTKLTKDEFEQRWNARFYDPAFDTMRAEIRRLFEIAWEAYDDHRKSPRTIKAGPDFADPEHELSIEWLETRARIQEADRTQKSSESRSRILFSRSQQSNRGVRSRHLPMQSLRLNRDPALSLAVLLLSEPRHGTGERLDE